MTQEEYQNWIEHIGKHYLPIPDSIIKDMSNWRHRSILARALARAGEYEPARELFLSIVDVPVTTQGEDDPGLSEIEDKVWCLKELATVIWRMTEERKGAIRYMTEAQNLMEMYPQQRFEFLDRNEVLSEIQDFINPIAKV